MLFDYLDCQAALQVSLALPDPSLLKSHEFLLGEQAIPTRTSLESPWDLLNPPNTKFLQFINFVALHLVSAKYAGTLVTNVFAILAKFATHLTVLFTSNEDVLGKNDVHSTDLESSYQSLMSSLGLDVKSLKNDSIY
ncbi:hypothetical protein BDZ91DRAFT_795918 [Kalaharituber pfeilii]|nr:hypothetical protein BDZ91DRAFT_795918 [Kalaharituber pfeilii]